MKQITMNGYTRISKAKARKLYDQGNTICLNPAKMIPGGQWLMTAHVNNLFDTEFDTVCNAFEYYNCNSETGRYIAFYVENTI